MTRAVERMVGKIGVPPMAAEFYLHLSAKI